jgi:hypothetical protein
MTEALERPICGQIFHTGFWDCGAYGGNRVLMALLQLLANRSIMENLLERKVSPRHSNY